MVGPQGVQGSRRTRTTRGRMAPPDPGRTVRRAWTTGDPGSRATRPTATPARARCFGRVGQGGGAGSRSSWHPVLRTLAGAARPNDPTGSPSAAAERASRLRGIGSGHDRTRPSGRFGSAVGPALAACSRGPARRPPPLSPITSRQARAGRSVRAARTAHAQTSRPASLPRPAAQIVGSPSDARRSHSDRCPSSGSPCRWRHASSAKRTARGCTTASGGPAGSTLCTRRSHWSFT